MEIYASVRRRARSSRVSVICHVSARRYCLCLFAIGGCRNFGTFACDWLEAVSLASPTLCSHLCFPFPALKAHLYIAGVSEDGH